MDVGIPQSLETAYGEFVFNDLTGTPASVSGTGAGSLYPGIPVFPNVVGGALIQAISGMTGASVRNPTTIKPHKSGAIVHTFHRTARIPTIEGIIVASTPAIRQTIVDQLLGCTDAMVAADARWVFSPAGGLPKRFLTARLYDEVDVLGPPSMSGGSPAGIAGPKNFTIVMIAGDWRVYTYTQDTTLINPASNATVPNVGNTPTWPLVRAYGPLTSFTLTQMTSGESVTVNHTIANGDWATVNMQEETIYRNDNLDNLLGYLDLVNSDFFSIPAGGVSLAYAADGGHAQVLSNSAWV